MFAFAAGFGKDTITDFVAGAGVAGAAPLRFVDDLPHGVLPVGRADGTTGFGRRTPKEFYVSPFSGLDLAFDFELHELGKRLGVALFPVSLEHAECGAADAVAAHLRLGAIGVEDAHLRVCCF